MGERPVAKIRRSSSPWPCTPRAKTITRGFARVRWTRPSGARRTAPAAQLRGHRDWAHADALGLPDAPPVEQQRVLLHVVHCCSVRPGRQVQSQTRRLRLNGLFNFIDHDRRRDRKKLCGSLMSTSARAKHDRPGDGSGSISVRAHPAPPVHKSTVQSIAQQGGGTSGQEEWEDAIRASRQTPHAGRWPEDTERNFVCPHTWMGEATGTSTRGGGLWIECHQDQSTVALAHKRAQVVLQISELRN